MAKITGLSADDRKLIQKLLTKVNKWPENPPGRSHNQIESDTFGQASDCYVARTPSTGIRGLISARPGYATCRIYQIVPSSTTPILSEVQSDRTVYNVSISAISKNTWIVIAKDKFGKWLALGGGSGAAVPGVVIDPTPRGTGTGTRLPPGVSRPGTGTGTGTGTHDGNIPNWYGTGSPPFVSPVSGSMEFVSSVSCVNGAIVYSTLYMNFVNGLFVGVTDRRQTDIPQVGT